MFGGFGAQELIWILIIVLVLFGGRKIPEIMKGLAEGLREFRKVSSQATEDIRKLAEPDEPTEQQSKTS